MKRFISLLMILCLSTAVIFADEPGDEYDDGYVYEQNGSGDQFMKLDLMVNFPLNFGTQLYTGVAASLGYFRFISSNIALGGSLILGYNLSIGEKPLIVVPITFEVMYQPTAGKFEFPMTIGLGISSMTCQNMNYFPGFTAKVTGGAYYRLAEGWSVGIDGAAFWAPEWFKDSSKNDNGLFADVGISARYHF